MSRAGLGPPPCRVLGFYPLAGSSPWQVQFKHNAACVCSKLDFVFEDTRFRRGFPKYERKQISSLPWDKSVACFTMQFPVIEVVFLAFGIAMPVHQEDEVFLGVRCGKAHSFFVTQLCQSGPHAFTQLWFLATAFARSRLSCGQHALGCLLGFGKQSGFFI